MILNKFVKQNLIHPPKWLPNNTHYLTIMGSMAYGVSASNSDMDVYGFTMPPKEMIFPHLAGEIPGFGRQIQRFEQWQEHHIKTLDGNQEYDFQVFSIVKYFQLLMENNPNIIDSLFTPRRCIIHSTHVGEIVRENRKTFLHKGAWSKFKGYSFSQFAKIRTKRSSQNEKRMADIQEHGYDLKFAYHVVRLLNEVEQILVEHDLDLERNREQLKSIRRGEWSFEQLEEYFTTKERILEETYARSTLPYGPDENRIKQILLNCIEQHYGCIDNLIVRDTKHANILSDLQEIINRYS